PRLVNIKDQLFVVGATGEPILLRGPNVVVKGPPYLPSVSGDSYCVDSIVEGCQYDNTCQSCTTFNQADVDHIKSMGWNSIRLGVVWAGAQPRNEDSLDADFLARLHDILDLTDANGLHVILDNHGDMVASAGCGNGIPMWFSQEASPELIGKPLSTGLPYAIVPGVNVKNTDGYDICGDDPELWAQYAGDPNYNLLNECCLAMNSPNPAGLGWTEINQAAMDYLVLEGNGRDHFVRYWRLMAEAVVEHPSAFATELLNEPMTIRRGSMFDTWRACAETITAVIPDMSVSLADVGEGAVFPSFITERSPWFAISDETSEWIAASSNVFYAWHWYGSPSDPKVAVNNALAIGSSWNVPTFLTEFMSCDILNAAFNEGISYSYWHYSSYCTTGPYFGNLTVPEDTFGACILGWGGGDSSYTCDI
ncbi:unnamed protein product, partial [Ectocarpus fasciculatus]